jgi:hypothetical protein
VKKFLVTLLMGAFLFSSLAATIGCGDGDKDKKDKDKKEKAADKEKKTDK